MTIGDIVAAAGVTRPTLYRRWSSKYELAVEALQQGLRRQREAYPPLDLDDAQMREQGNRPRCEEFAAVLTEL